MGVALSDFGRQLVLCRLPYPGATMQLVSEQDTVRATSWRRLAASSYAHAESLQRLLLHADIWRLRTLLAHEEGSVYRLNDYRVRAAAAHLVERGILGLFECINAMDRAAGASASLAVAATAQALLAAAPSARAAGLTAGRSSPVPSTLPARALPIEETEPFDQQMQAAVLSAASRLGTPFCEECTRRALQRKEAVAT